MMGFISPSIRIAKKEDLLACASNYFQVARLASVISDRQSGAVKQVGRWYAHTQGGMCWGFSSTSYLHYILGVRDIPHNSGVWQSVMTDQVEQLGREYDYSSMHAASAGFWNYTAGDMYAYALPVYGQYRLLHFEDDSEDNDQFILAATAAVMESELNDFCRTNDWLMSFEAATQTYVFAEAPEKGAVYLQSLGINSWSDVSPKLQWIREKSAVSFFEDSCPDPQLRRVNTLEAMVHCQQYITQPSKYEVRMKDWIPEAERFIARADERHNLTTQQHVCNTAAIVYEKLGRPQDAASVCKATIVSVEKANMGMVQFVAAHLYHGRACSQVAQYDEAITLLRNAIDLAQQCELKLLETHARRDLKKIIEKQRQ